MAQLITVRLNKSDHQPLGFRLQGGKDFGTPLVVQKVNGGSAAERAGLQAGDALIRVNATEVYALRHQEAQDAIRAAGGALELTVQRGGGTWRPAVTPTGSLPRPGSRPLGSAPAPVTNTSLKATPQPSRAFGNGHNNVAKPFGYMNGNDSVKSIVNKQYNTPVNMYSDKTIAETLSAQTEVLAGGVLGVNFKKNERTYDAEKSAVFKVLQEEQSDPEPVESSASVPSSMAPVSGLRSVQAPVTRPDAPLNNTGGLPVGQNICEECERLITGVFVRIKDKNLHVECFKCSTCGSSLKNQGYYNLNGKLYCDIHAKLVARQNPPASNLEPVTVPPGARIPTNTYSTPLPPLATNNYSNGSSSMFSPSSNMSGPKPFGSSLGSAYSPSLSPRSAPLSPARPVAAPAPLLATAPPAPAAPYAPPAAPFAPTQNLKSVVWPPPNPLEDDPPKRELSPVSTISNNRRESVPQIVSNMNNGSNLQTASSEQTRKQISSHQKEFCSNVSSTAASSSVTATSNKSELIVQGHESHSVQETSSCTVQSYSHEASSECQSMSLYQSESGPTIQQTPSKPNKIENIVESEIQSKELKNVQLLQDQTIKTESDSYERKVEENPVDLMMMSNVNNTTCLDEKNIEQVAETIVEKTVQIAETMANNISTISDNINTCDDIEITKKEEIHDKDSCNMLSNEFNRLPENSLLDALTTAPNRPYSPLPCPQQPTNLPPCNIVNSTNPETKPVLEEAKATREIKPVQLEAKPEMPLQIKTLSFQQQEKRGITPIPPIKEYKPPEVPSEPVPMPPETKPYIPQDFKINIEQKGLEIPRGMTCSPMIDALTTVPDRPFTPTSTISAPIERGSLIEALTIAPDRPYSPLPLHIPYQSSHLTSSTTTSTSTSTVQMVSSSASEIVRPIATQTSQVSNQNASEFTSSVQNTFQSSMETSAFKPIAKQVFPQPQPEEFCKLTNFPPITNELKTSFAKHTSKQESTVTEALTMHSTMSSNSMSNQAYSAVKTAQNFFEHLDQKECLSSISVRSTSGLHKPDSIPPYQKNFEMLPSQRGVTPELCNAPAVLLRPITPTSNPPTKIRGQSQELNHTYRNNEEVTSQIKTPVDVAHYQMPNKTVSYQHNMPLQLPKDTPISMTFQPVTDEAFIRASPIRSRPTTPSSMINKPAPIIPHYQMNLVTVEHIAPESHLFEPSSPEVSRSPTPKLRSRSPAQGPPPNPLKAQAPRVKETTSQKQSQQTLLSQATSNLRREHEHEMNYDVQKNLEIYNNTSGVKSWAQDQPSVIREQKYSNTGFNSENYSAGDVQRKEDSLSQHNYAQRQMQSQNVSEFGNTKVHTTRKTFEEFERSQSAKVIEIRKGDFSSAPNTYYQRESNTQPSNINAKQVFPPPVMSFSTSQSSSVNNTNQNVATTSRTLECQPKPSISGANHGPACDPTPSTGSSVGAAARGKTFGVSSAPKRGRGVLNKAALPGSRVPLCGSCNGNIRGPFITALGRIWCPEHFVCVNATCKRPLQDIGFVEENGQLYCEYCFEQYIAPACNKCHAKIKGDCLNAIGKHFHPECFSCVYCGKLFGNNPFFLEDGLPYCESDWNELFTTKCFACGFPVEAGDRWVEALNNNYHSQCFNCTVCKKNLEGQSFFAKGGRPFCKTHAR